MFVSGDTAIGLPGTKDRIQKQWILLKEIFTLNANILVVWPNVKEEKKFWEVYMNKKINIWGRSFDLPVDFDTYKDETATKEQEERLDTFCKESDDLLSDPEPMYKYCLENNKDDIGSKITNIFAYVIPKSIFVPTGKIKSIVVRL